MLFEDKLCRDYFKSLKSDAMKFKFVDDEYKKYLLGFNDLGFM